MSDDFDDDLYNMYNGGNQEDSYNDEDLYGEDPVVDIKHEEDDAAREDTEQDLEQDDSSPQQEQQHAENDSTNGSSNNNNNNRYMQQQQQQNMMSNNWGFQGNPYQQFMAYQMSLQQMGMNPYQMQQMMQQQMRQQMPQQQHYQPQQQQRQQTRSDKPKENDESDVGKMFVGGLNWETTDDSLRQYFSQFGKVVDVNVMRDPTTQRSRGFAFMTMEDDESVQKIVSQSDHQLDGKRIDPKKAIPRDEQDKTEKIFVGGISAEVNEEEFREFFTQFGTVIDATLMLDRDTGRPRGFGFITFEDSTGVEEALKNPNLAIKDKTIEVKKAMPKNKQQRMAAMATPVLNPNFRPQQGGYMPNTRYANTANYGNMMNRNNFNAMYGGNMYNGAYNMAAAASYYNNNNNSGGGSSNNGGHSSSHRESGSHRESREGGSSSSERGSSRSHRHHQDDSRDEKRSSRDRGSSSSGGGAVHASQSRNSQHYRPY